MGFSPDKVEHLCKRLYANAHDHLYVSHAIQGSPIERYVFELTEGDCFATANNEFHAHRRFQWWFSASFPQEYIDGMYRGTAAKDVLKLIAEASFDEGDGRKQPFSDTIRQCLLAAYILGVKMPMEEFGAGFGSTATLGVTLCPEFQFLFRRSLLGVQKSTVCDEYVNAMVKGNQGLLPDGLLERLWKLKFFRATKPQMEKVLHDCDQALIRDIVNKLYAPTLSYEPRRSHRKIDV